MDEVFKALADPHRRELLDRLNRRNGQTLQELCAGLDMARQSVTKHLAVLEAAGIVATSRRGREKLHYLDAAPINDIADRWIGRYRNQARALADLKRTLEDRSVAEFVYTTYIKTTPEQLWNALIDPAFTKRYWGSELKSEWTVGAPIYWDDEDLDQVVLASEPPRLLSYTWHNYQPAHATFFGWDDDYFARLTSEDRSKVTFTLEPVGDAVKLTVVHDGFAGDTEMLRAVSGRNPKTGGWPEILASLKSLLETGSTL
jgi:uncharacterized protein YndB with AHSA1/START domain/DNA-binding transcriptional ArsR family regulator